MMTLKYLIVVVSLLAVGGTASALDFGKLLEEAAARKLVELEADEKSGGVVIKRFATED